jgi:DNA-binding transcriptional LysR family regulator
MNIFSKSGLSLERLRTFSEVVAATGISHAAPGDPNRQSQFSRQLRELEEFFGAQLIVRGGGRFQLTQEGEELFQIVQFHFRALEDLLRRCSSENVDITIGAGDSILHGWVLPNLGKLRGEFPKATFSLANLRNEQTLDGLIKGQIDLGIVSGAEERASLSYLPIGSIRFGLLTPDRSIKEVPKKKLWNLIARTPIAVLAESEIASAFEAEASKAGMNLNVCLRGSSYPQIVEAIRQIGCAALVPTFAATGMLDQCDLVSLPVLDSFTRKASIVWDPRQSNLRPVVQKFAETLRELLSCNLVASPRGGRNKKRN